MVDKTASRWKRFFSIQELSFAPQKNDMLLRNMIYLLNANMIDSTDVEYDISRVNTGCD